MQTNDPRHALLFREPGSPWGWADHFVLGNGRLGVTFGGVPGREVLRLNEETVWARGAEDATNPDAARTLPEVRRLLAAGRVAEAEFLADAGMMGLPRHVEPYQPVAQLHVEFAPSGTRRR